MIFLSLLTFDKNTVAFVSSYSGNTEEVLTALNLISKKTKKIIVFCAGGELLQIAKKNHWPCYKIDTADNPCNQPRMGIAYQFIATLAMFKKAGPDSS